jgi:Secretion system C-terminal sorting domain
MKKLIVFVGIFTAITVLVYQATNPLQSAITFINDKQKNTSVSFDIANRSFVRLTLFDLSGKELSSFINEELEAGIHTISIDDERLSNGKYFYKLTTDNQLNIKKISLDNSPDENISYR